MAAERGRSGDGTAQSHRFSGALEDGYFGVDEMGLDTLISISARHAGNLRYEPSGGGPAGTWADLVTADPVFALAEISRLSMRRQAAFLRALSHLRDPLRLARFVRYLAYTMDSCFRALERGAEPEIEGLRHRFEQLMRERGDDLRHAEAFLEANEKPEARGRAPAWHRVWSESPPAAARTRPAEQDLERLDGSSHHFLHAFAQLKQATDGLLERALSGGDRQPALGLALTFFELFAQAQASLNEIARKRLEFYLLDVLRFAPHGRVPDQAYITLGAAPGVRELFVPGGTEFTAGRDEHKNELIFVTTDDVMITDARVETIATAQFDCDELVSPERELGFVTRIRAQRVDREHFDLQGQRDAPLFRSALGEGRHVLGDEAKLGFAIASPLLDLREGRRVIRFRIELAVPEGLDALAAELEQAADDETPERFFVRFGKLFTKEVMTSSPDSPEAAAGRERIRAIARKVLRGPDQAASLRTIEGLLDRDRRSVFHDLFRRAFEIRVTGEKGWHEVVAHHVSLLPAGVGLEIILDLGPEAAPIVGYDPEVHGSGYDTTLPMVGFRVSSDAIFHPYSMLRALDLDKVTIRVEVTGARTLFAYNQVGGIL